jgi:MoaA/NifB/PqqE/SkfB family radical SAM enzyme
MMCNIWKIPPEVPNLSIEKWAALLDTGFFSNLIELDITGGEPFLRKDLSDFFFMTCELQQVRLKALKSVSVTTNGFLTDRVLSVVERVLPIFQRRRLDLVVVCAMDAIGSLHDKIRNYKNGWEKANQTIKELICLKEKYPNLIVGLKTTILPLNIDALNAISEYAHDRGLFTIISPCIITEGRYLNVDKKEAFSFNQDDIAKMIDFYSHERGIWRFHSQALIHYFKTGIMKKPCTCGFNYLFLRSSGEMLLCPLIGENVGNVSQTSAKDLFLSSKADRMRKQIGKLAQCTSCTEPGLERYALPFEGFSYLRLLAQIGEKRFLKTHYRTGLDKYFI